MATSACCRGAIVAAVVAVVAALGTPWGEQPRAPGSSSWPPTPDAPALLHSGPVKDWLVAGRAASWEPSKLHALARSTAAGDYLVNLQSQNGSPAFLPHKGESKLTQARHTTTPTPLRAALAAVWPNLEAQSEAVAPTAEANYYISADVEDMPPEIASPVLGLLPDSCIEDVRFSGGSAGGEEQPCRGLRSNLWFGAAGVSAATHFDLSHNLFVQASGRKTFSLLPPSAHRLARLHPIWHGSHLAARTRLSPAEVTAAGGFEVTLDAGDVLYLPPAWLHRVVSVEPNVGLNLWTDSLLVDVHRHVSDRQTWGRLVRGCTSTSTSTADATGAADAPPADLAALAACARRVVHELVDAVQRHARPSSVPGEPTATLSVGRRARLLLRARYDAASTSWDAAVPAFVSAASEEARRHVASACDEARRAGDAAATATAATLPPPLREELDGFARAFALLGEGSRDLLLDEWVEGLARFVVGPAADEMLGLTLGDAAVGTFVEGCFV